MIRVSLERHLENSLCLYPELIDDRLWGIRQGMEVLGQDFPTLKRQDRMPNGRIADMVFVEPHRVTVVEIKRDALSTKGDGESGEDVLDQVTDYLKQCKIKYPNRSEYVGIVVGTAIAEPDKFLHKLSCCADEIRPLIFGRDIPASIKFCDCGRALDYYASSCRCGARFR